MTDTATLDRALGWTLAVEPLDRLDGAAGGLDLAFATVAGEAALMQSLTLAFATLKGADVFHRNFGFSGLAAIAEENDRVIRRERIRMAVISTLQAEPRIRRIVTVRYADETGAAAPPATPRPPARFTRIEAVFETIAGTRQTIALEGEALDVK